MPTPTILAAEFTTGSKRRQPTLTFNRIANGAREFVWEVPVSDKRHARAVAKTHGLTPWNF